MLEKHNCHPDSIGGDHKIVMTTVQSLCTERTNSQLTSIQRIDKSNKKVDEP